jgi:hypothetical protein
MDKLLVAVPVLLALACPLMMVLMGVAGWRMARKRKRTAADTVAPMQTKTNEAVEPPRIDRATGTPMAGDRPTISARP